MTREEIKKAMRDTKKEVVIKNLHKLLSLVEGYLEYEDCIGYAIEKLEQEPILNEIRAEIKEKIEQEEFARSVFRHEEKDAVKAEQCTGSIMAYNNVIKLIDKHMESEVENG